MININEQILFFALQKLITITIVFHISNQSAVRNQFKHNITGFQI